MEANPFYFRDRPKLDRIVYVFLPDENTLTPQILAGEIDIAIREQPTQLLRLRDAARDIARRDAVGKYRIHRFHDEQDAV